MQPAKVVNNAMKKKMNKKVVKRVISFAVIIALSLGIVPMPEIVDEIRESITQYSEIIAYADVPLSFDYDTQLTEYAAAYIKDPSSHQNDILTLQCTNTLEVPSDFPGIGTAEYPFKGTLKIMNVSGDNGGASSYLQLKAPLFNYISDTAKILDSNNNNCTLYLYPSALDTYNTPLFANHVAGMGGSAEWRIKVNSGNKRSSIIGELYNKTSDPNVSLTYYNMSAVISGTENLGVVCNTISAGSLNLTLTNGLNVSSISTTPTETGHVGGVVGKMEADTSLTIKTAMSFGSARTIKTTSGYAGGLVGYCEGTVTLDTNVTYNDSNETSIQGTSGAGGVFGYFAASDNIDLPYFDKFTIKTADSTASVTVTTTAIWAENGSVGGFIGALENKGNGKKITIQASSNTSSSNSFYIGGKDGGGLVGLYKPNRLNNTLEIKNLYAKSNGTQLSGYYGGLIGKIESDASGNGAYVDINNVSVEVNAVEPYADRTVTNYTGGLIGYTNGGFIDITGNVAVEQANYKPDKYLAGLIYESESGVVRLAGTTDLTAMTTANALLIQNRGNTLVYALGNGATGWIYKRPNVNQKIDDLNPWGQVVRYVSTTENAATNTQTLEGAGIVTVNGSDHTVTLAAAVSAMATSADFAKTALNIKLNTNDRNFGALKFTNGSKDSADLMADSLSFTNNIVLTGSGLTGLTRDDGSTAVFTGSLDGNSKSLTLATGEAYGYKGTSLAAMGTDFGDAGVIANYLTGAIASHTYNGLFAKMGKASVENLMLEGSISVCSPAVDNSKVGGIAAEIIGGNASFDGITCHENIYLYNADKNVYVGFLVGLVSNNNATATLSINDTDLTGTAWVNCSEARIGLIGAITDIAIDVTINDVDLTGTINYKGSGRPYAGGLIGRMPSDNTYSRNVTLTDIDVKKLIVSTNMTGNDDIDKKISNPAGGLLGGQWLRTNVFFGNSIAANAVKVTSGTLTLSGNSTYAGGLVADATGYWQVNDIDITAMSVTGASDGLGLLVLNGKNGSDGLYLEMTSSGAYSIQNDLAVTNTAPSVAYDEIMAFSKGINQVKVSNVITGFVPSESNAQAIISIRTTDTTVSGVTKPRLSMTSGSDNSYSPVTSLGSNHNPFTRYYYNLDYLLKNASTGGEKMLLWSVYLYAAGNIQNNTKIKTENTKYFKDYTSLPSSGTVDFEYLSYYPVDVGNLTVPSLTFKLHNSQMQAAHGGTYDLNSLDEDSNISQHYLMHAGLFKNITAGTLTLNNVTLQGDVSAHAASAYVDAGSGAILCGYIQGADTNNKAGLTINGLVLDGIKVNGTSGINALIVKEIGKNTTINISNIITTSSYNSDSTTTTAAKYLMGEADGSAMTIVFDKMILDGRTTSSALYNPNADADTDAGKLNSAYNTYSSIFSEATFLKSLKYTAGSGSSAKYEYKWAEDWGTTKHQVTYGKEISETTENVGEQLRYVDRYENYYTSPVSDSAAAPYTFTSFKPHVMQAYSSSENYHEVAVNIVSSNLDEGCGTYNDPFVVDGTQLDVVAKALSNGDFLNNFSLYIDDNYHSEQDTANINFEKWCDNKTGHKKWTYDGSKFSADGVLYTLSKECVLDYLAGAYYYVSGNTSLPSGYTGLGGTTARTAFRGVIVGASGVTITNPTQFPLINTSNGSVVKNITINVTAASIAKNAADSGSTGKFGYSTTTEYYGGVIGEIMGGDNIIDNVKVTYDSGASITVGGTASYNVPMGAYIGVVVNGSVIFRNMTSTSDGVTTAHTDLSSTHFHVSGVDIEKDATVNANGTETFTNLYVNPIIGRVINGFAIYESDAYRYSEDGYYVDKNSSDRSTSRADSAHQTTLKNGRKNFSIPDFNSGSEHSVLTFSKSTGANYNDVVTVADAQSLYIMSLICQTNMGSASGDAGNYTTKTDSGYDGNSTSYKATHLGYYDDVYSITSKNTNYNRTISDKANDKTEIPYLIYEYTNHPDSATKYPARTLTNRTDGVDIVLSESNTPFYLPDSFRGIGSIGSGAKITLKSFKGNGNTIDLNTYFRTNSCSKDNYYSSATWVGVALFNTASSNGLTITNGVPDKAIFDNFTLSGYISAKRTDDAGTLVDNVYGNNSGSYWNVGGILSYEASAINYSFEKINFNNLVIDSNQNAGAIIPRFSDNIASICINNCNSDKLSVSGFQYLGGLIGQPGKASIFLNTKSNAYSSYKVFVYQKGNTSYCATGGLLSTIGGNGHLIAKNIDIIGWNGSFDSNSSRIPTIGRFLTDYITSSGLDVGGLVGLFGDGNNRIINNVNVYGVNIAGYHVGGIVANEGDSWNGPSMRINISNCGVHGISDDRITIPSATYTIKGHLISGGISGRAWGNVYLTGKPGMTESLTFDYFGITYNRETSGCYVNNYTIRTQAKTKGCAGGIFGHSRNRKLVRDCKVEKCIFECADGSEKVGFTTAEMGGITGGHSKYNLLGYNLTVSDLTFKADKGINAQYGLIGNRLNNDNDPAILIQVAGFTTSGNNIVKFDYGSTYTGIRNVEFIVGRPHNSTTATTADFTNTNGYDTASYIIRADSQAVCNSNNKGTKLSGVKASGVTNVSMRSKTTTTVDGKTITTYGTEVSTETESTVNDIFPYVISSPFTQLGNDCLTGDGIAFTQSGDTVSTMADTIISQKNSDEIAVYRKYSNITDKDIAIYNKIKEDGKISTYNTEYGSDLLTNDIPVIVMDNNDYTFTVTVGNTTYDKLKWKDAFQAYMRILTNTSYNFDNGHTTSSESNVFEIEILKCIYNNNSLTASTSGATVNLDSSGAYNMTSSYDSSTPGQFTVLDVKFFDPSSDKSKVAYHLYVPVYTKKSFNYKFDITALSGTNYYMDSYVGGNHFTNLNTLRNRDSSNAVVENYGTPVTMFIRYEYETADIIKDLLAGGYGLDWNYNKALNFEYNYSSALPSGTKFVLIDANQNDKANYSTGFAPVAGADLYINSTTFPASEASALPTSYSAYSVISFKNLLAKNGVTLSASALANSEAIEAARTAQTPIFHAVTSSEQFTASGVKLVPATDDDITNATDLYTVTASSSKIYEDYYLTIYAPAGSGDLRHQFEVSSKKSLNADGKMIASCNANDREILMFANLFTKDITIKTIENDDSDVLMGSDGQSSLNVQAISTINFNSTALGDQLNEVKGALDQRNVSVFHSTQLQLKRFDTDGSSKTIAVDGTQFTLAPAASGYEHNYEYNSGIYVNKLEGDTGTSYYNNNNNTGDEYLQVISCAGSNGLSGNRVTNFYEVVNKNNGSSIDLRPYLTGSTAVGFDGNVHEVKVVANFSMEFTANGIIDQFSQRTSDTAREGSTVSGMAALAYSEDDTSYSNNKSELKNAIPNGRRYYRKEAAKTELRYNVLTDDTLASADAKIKTNAVLGINPFDEGMSTKTMSSISTWGNYNTTQLAGADKAAQVKWTLTLYRRERKNSTAKEYGDPLPINQYLKNIKLYGIASDATKGSEVSLTSGSLTTDTELIYTASRASFEDMTVKINSEDTVTNKFIAYIDYDVITGTELQSAEQFYSNYKVVLTAELVGNTSSKANDHIIYTNAKLDPSFID